MRLARPGPDGPVPGALTDHDVFDAAKWHGAAVFIITGRDESQRAATARNLAEVGYTGYTGLIMEPVGGQFPSASDFKAPRRGALEDADFTIIANLGDQPSDLGGGHAEQTYLLPNPFSRISRLPNDCPLRHDGDGTPWYHARRERHG